jgi:uncharacterized membrane protein
MRSAPRLQLAAFILLFIAYAGLSHYSNSDPQARDLGAALALAPLFGVGFVLLWRGGGRAAAIAAAAAAAVLLQHYWPLFARNFSLLNLLQQSGFYAIMALSFARSLLYGRVPLCTQLADKIHGPLSAHEQRYTRRVTAAWAIFFALNMIATCALFEFAPRRIWSLFVNFCSLPLILLMFAAEYAVRRLALPHVPRGGLLATVRVYFANPH